MMVLSAWLSDDRKKDEFALYCQKAWKVFLVSLSAFLFNLDQGNYFFYADFYVQSSEYTWLNTGTSNGYMWHHILLLFKKPLRLICYIIVCYDKGRNCCLGDPLKVPDNYIAYNRKIWMLVNFSI